MIKIKKASQILDKEEGAKILEDKIYPSQNKMEQLILDTWLDDIGSKTRELSFNDNDKWIEFKDKYGDEFEDKLELMDSIMVKKKEKLKVTWIAVFKKTFAE
ncbi:DUF488 family protein [Methanobacterium sp. SMA-27]|jgi:uncharacterized protein YeaO (DUF488 family)|uniref:DUF488 family protein, N3 subclade n=1 Tax=Methanobacterium sp. SMA-27 TaxID=1495336 RepID=UPI00064F1592|nr:DUF488 family protein [Methanobacterium sp. SMA-27]